MAEINFLTLWLPLLMLCHVVVEHSMIKAMNIANNHNQTTEQSFNILHNIQHQNVSTDLINYEPINLYSQASLSNPLIHSSTILSSSSQSTTPIPISSTTSSLPDMKSLIHLKLPDVQISKKMYYLDTIHPPPPITDSLLENDCKDKCNSPPSFQVEFSLPSQSIQQSSQFLSQHSSHPLASLMMVSNETKYYPSMSSSNHNPNYNSGNYNSNQESDQEVSSLPTTTNRNPYPYDSYTLMASPPSTSLPPETLQQLLRPSMSMEMLDDELETINQQLIGGHQPSTDEYLKKLNLQSQFENSQFFNMNTYAASPIQMHFTSPPQPPQPVMQPQREGSLFTRFIGRVYRSPSYFSDYIRPNKISSSFLSNIFNFGSSSLNKYQQQPQHQTMASSPWPIFSSLLNYNNDNNNNNVESAIFVNQPKQPSRLRMLMSRHRLGMALVGSPSTNDQNKLFLQPTLMANTKPSSYLPSSPRGMSVY